MWRYAFDTEAWGALIGRARHSIATDMNDCPGRLELAELLDVHPNTIDAWEKREYANKRFEHPSMSNMLKVCTLTGFDPARLFKMETR